MSRYGRVAGESTLYAPAVALVAGALLLTLILQHVQQKPPSLFLFYVAIVGAAWIGGRGPGLLAAALSGPAGLYFNTGALHGYVLSVDSVILSASFLTCAVAGGALNAWRLSNAEGLRKSHRALEIKALELQYANERLRAQIANREHAERALRETQSELMRIERLTTMGQLTASIAHEVKQPLTAIIANASSCARWLDRATPDIAEARAAALRIVRDGERANEVIGHIRALTRRGAAQHSDLNVGDAIASVLALTANELEANGVRVRVCLPPSMPPIKGDRIQLQQLFLNLIMNAIEAMAQMPVAARSLSVQGRTDADQITLTIADSGCGLAPDVARNLFQAFTTNKPNGMGLGLSICRTIVETHGGTIEAGPAAACRGAAFTIALPLSTDVP